ncbi:MAG: theronine dehydrogenase, partial [Alphaproteobacteria bacterium CG_4_10_14_0_8_um_filter_53_9]
MFQVVQDVKGGKVKMMDVPVPACGDNEILVKVRASLISAGTEKMVMDFAEKSLLGKAQARPDLVQKVLQKMRKDGVAETVASVFARLDEPMPLGYSMAGEVVAVGTKLSAEFKIGDRVAGAGAGLANHADYVALPRNLTVPIPSGVPYEEACYATLGAIALHGVRNAAVGIGDRVLVVGLGLVGQLATQLAVAAGADVAALDMDVGRCDLAVQGGATAACTPADLSPISSIHAGRGFDAVLLCAATESDALMQQAADLARDRARVILVGKVGTRFDYASYMKKELTVGVSRSYGAGRYDPAFEQVGLSYPVGYVPHTERDNLAEVLRLMALGKVRPDVLTTHTFNFKNALEAYDMIKHKKAFLGIVLAYEETEGETEVLGGAAEVNGAATGVRVSRDEVGVGFLGVGSFARTVLLPTLVKVAGAHVVRLVSKGGLSAAGARDKFAKTA